MKSKRLSFSARREVLRAGRELAFRLHHPPPDAHRQVIRSPIVRKEEKSDDTNNSLKTCFVSSRCSCAACLELGPASWRRRARWRRPRRTWRRRAWRWRRLARRWRHMEWRRRHLARRRLEPRRLQLLLWLGLPLLRIWLLTLVVSLPGLLWLRLQL